MNETITTPLKLLPGSMVKILGQPKQNATYVTINFQTGPSNVFPTDDIALQIKSSKSLEKIARNSARQGIWGLPEIYSWVDETIISEHKQFVISVSVQEKEFLIGINGKHYCEFRHRIPIQQITHLVIDTKVVDVYEIIINHKYQNHQIDSTLFGHLLRPPTINLNGLQSTLIQHLTSSQNPYLYAGYQYFNEAGTNLEQMSHLRWPYNSVPSNSVLSNSFTYPNGNLQIESPPSYSSILPGVNYSQSPTRPPFNQR